MVLSSHQNALRKWVNKWRKWVIKNALRERINSLINWKLYIGLIIFTKLYMHKIFLKFESLFDGTLGTWEGTEYNIELKPGVKTHHGRPYIVPQAYKKEVCRKVDQLVQICVLYKINCS